MTAFHSSQSPIAYSRNIYQSCSRPLFYQISEECSVTDPKNHAVAVCDISVIYTENYIWHIWILPLQRKQETEVCMHVHTHTYIEKPCTSVNVIEFWEIESYPSVTCTILLYSTCKWLWKILYCIELTWILTKTTATEARMLNHRI